MTGKRGVPQNEPGGEAQNHQDGEEKGSPGRGY